MSQEKEGQIVIDDSHEDEVLRHVVKSGKAAQQAVLNDCKVGLEILKEYDEERDLDLRQRVMDYIIDVDFREDDSIIVHGLINLQWECRMMQICALAFMIDDEMSTEDREYNQNNRQQVIEMLENRVKVITGLLNN